MKTLIPDPKNEAEESAKKEEGKFTLAARRKKADISEKEANEIAAEAIAWARSQSRESC